MGWRVHKLHSLMLTINLELSALYYDHHHSLSSDIRPRGLLEVSEVDEKVHSWMSSGVIRIFVAAVAVT